MFLKALVATLIVSAIPLGLALAFPRGKHGRISVMMYGGMAVIAVTLINWWIFFGSMPTVGFTMDSFYKSFGLWLGEFVVFTIVAGFAAFDYDGDLYYFKDFVRAFAPGTMVSVAVIVTMLGILIFQGVGGVWSQGRADKLVNLTVSEEAGVGVYPNTDAEHLLLVSSETAELKADNAMGTGENRNLNTIYDRGNATLQSVNNHLYWLFPLSPSGWKNYGKVKGVVPGYIVVDAENPAPTATLQTTFNDGQDPKKKLEIKYSPEGSYDGKLERHVWKNGYAGKVVTDLTLEVDDNWRPYFTASLDKLTLGFKRTVPNKLLIVDAQTGAIQETPLDKLPNWVDRIYSSETVEQLLNWRGEWGKAPYKLMFAGSANRYKAAKDEDPVLVYTKSGHPVWQVIITSYKKDDTASYLALFEGRTNKVTLYPISNLQLRNKAVETIAAKASADQKKVKPVHPTIHKIYGKLTWVMPLIAENSGNAQGLALLSADDGGSIQVVGTSASDALTQYRQKLAAGTTTEKPGENSNNKSAEGVIATLALQVEGGQTIYYFTLAGDTHVYRAGANPNLLELPFIKVGAKVRMTYVDTGTSRRDVGNYDDLALQLVNN
jgi:hypothetical protein